MTLPKIVSQEEWTAARRTLLEKEKDFTRQRDRLNTERRGGRERWATVASGVRRMGSEQGNAR